jgi:4-diphosphocytidyl-2-C-methyl-D-erythritol kinase
VSRMNTALATGTGTELQPIKAAKEYWLVLVNPGISVSTRWVYENLILTSEDNPYRLSGYSHVVEDAISLLEATFYREQGESPLFNDLERVTVGKHPVIGTIKEQLLNDGASAALMSGSGPTVFGIFRQLELAVKSCNTFRQLYEDVFLVSPLN